MIPQRQQGDRSPQAYGRSAPEAQPPWTPTDKSAHQTVELSLKETRHPGSKASMIPTAAARRPQSTGLRPECPSEAQPPWTAEALLPLCTDAALLRPSALNPASHRQKPPQTFLDKIPRATRHSNMETEVPSEEASTKGTRDWPHAPPHQLAEAGVYFLTARTSDGQHLLADDSIKDWFQETLLTVMAENNWKLEAWAILSNHYHIVAHSPAKRSGGATGLGTSDQKTAQPNHERTKSTR